MFIDKARIMLTAGRGGAGCISFHREKYTPLGGPDGGNGGKGGDIYLLADPHFKTLLDVSRKTKMEAGDGNTGGTNNRYGRGGEDLIVHVPVGTVIYKKGKFFEDLKIKDQSVLIAKGGRGGRGNSAFKTHSHTAPRIAEKGEPGEEAFIDLELMLIADVGILGMPNAGKSTLLSRISAARPKIADYPFTTLVPNLGFVSHKRANFIAVDVPGLIEGAHKGKGLGDEFLRHIKRTRVLIHLVDVFGNDGSSAEKTFKLIIEEVASYDSALAKKPMIIAVNKMDLTDSDKEFSKFKKKIKKRNIFPVSCISGEGIDALLDATVELLKEYRESEPIHEETKNYVYEPDFKVSKDGDIFVVTGEKVKKLVSMTFFTEADALHRFQNILKKMGIEKALEKIGIKEGDTVRIFGQEFIFRKWLT